MNRYQRLTIEGSSQELDVFIMRLKEIKSPFYFLAKLSKEYANNIYVPEGYALCLKTNRKSLLESKIWLVRSKNTVKVANITAEQSITRKEYNRILRTFVIEEIDKIRFGNLRVDLSDEEEGLESLLSEESYQKLKKWIKGYNRDNPISHAFDFERWVKFVISIYHHDSNLSMADFKVGLSEIDPALSSDNLNDLTSKLEYSLDFLRVYNNEDW